MQQQAPEGRIRVTRTQQQEAALTVPALGHMQAAGEDEIQRPDPPVVGKVNHHSIELYWDISNTYYRKVPSDKLFIFSIEEEDEKTHVYGTIYSGYSRQHVVEGLEPSTTYRFRLKVTGRNGAYAYSPVVSVSTTREPMNGAHFHRAVNMNDEAAVINILQTGLMLACFAGHLDVVEFLRNHGVPWDLRDRSGCAAMHWAADGGHLKVIEWMINDDCKVDIKDTCLEWTPLMRVSAISGNTEVAKCLINAGAEVNVKDKDGKTPLMVATLNNHEHLVRLLIERGADCSITNEYGISIAKMAKAFNRQNVMEMLEDTKKEIR
ncbi:fibronectin type 3 and ankyrin repeat domains protein 1 isoform X2 [Pseudophryne corroboree]|uniref:fibronectin type 3 and ankyrin repeat domains protein 1 isoform X2 n=1 Tax=Pseudophryne corroboree TaxID=495146 RepID=UPI003081BFEA